VLGLLIIGLGAVAIFGPKQTSAAVDLALGFLLVLTAWMGFLTLGSHRTRRSRRAVLAWSFLALAVGGAITSMPPHDLPPAGALLGVLFVGHGVAATSLAFRLWCGRGIFTAIASFASGVLLLIGLGFLLGGQPGERGDRFLIGFDIVLFGLYLVAGREVLEPAGVSNPSPRQASILRS